MNFKDWCKQYYGETKYNPDIYFASETAWIASKNHLKKEILQKIEETKSNTFTYGTVSTALIEEIQKL